MSNEAGLISCECISRLTCQKYIIRLLQTMLRETQLLNSNGQTESNSASHTDPWPDQNLWPGDPLPTLPLDRGQLRHWSRW